MIPDEAVEAAAKVHFNRGEGYWGDIIPEAKAEALDDMRAALEAAAPYLKSEAWDEGWQKAHSCDDPAMAGIFFNPYRSQP